MTAAVAARVPTQPGPPAAERTDEATLRRWDLVTAAQAGDRDAFGQLYAYYHPSVFRFIYARTRNQQVAEDLTADVFVRALRNIHSITWQGRDFGAWLTTIARNIVMDRFKSHRYRRELLDSTPGGHDTADPSPEGDPAALVALHFTNLELLAAVQQLNPEQQECIRLRFLLGLSIADTAAAMGKNEGAIKALQYRAVRSLARLLPPGLGESR